MSDATDVLADMYRAFAAGDMEALGRLIGETHWVEASGGPYGGVYSGLGEVAENVFGPIGRDVRNFAAVPDEILSVGNDRAMGLGFYRGETNAGPLETRFAHLAKVDGGRITEFEQFTDTHEWQKAVRGT